MKRCVIVGGAPIGDYPAVRKYLKEEDYYIFCDCGLQHQEGLGVKPHLIVGDFDSWTLPQTAGIQPGMLNRDLNHYYEDRPSLSGKAKESQPVFTETTPCFLPAEDTQIRILPPDKFDSDTVYGVREGMDRGFQDFLILGALGRRFDHSLSNLYILVMLEAAGKHGLLVDDYSDMEMIGAKPGYVDSSYDGFSLMNITGLAKGIRIEGAKYYYVPNDEIPCTYQYGLSNQVLPGQTAQITVRQGQLLLIRNRKKI